MGIMKLFMQKILRYRKLETQKEETSYQEQETKPVTEVEDALHFSLKKIAEEFAFREGVRIFQSDLLTLAGEYKPEISDVEEVGQKIHTEIKRIQTEISLLAGKVQKAEEISKGLKLLEDIETELKSIYPYEEEELDQDTLKESKTVEHLEKLSIGLLALLDNKEVLEKFGDLTVQLKAIHETVKELVQSYEEATSEEGVKELSQSAIEVFSSFQELLPLISSGIEEFTSSLIQDNKEVLSNVDHVEQFATFKSELIPLIVLNERLNNSIRAVKIEEDK
jgi:hypothetical protein